MLYTNTHSLFIAVILYTQPCTQRLYRSYSYVRLGGAEGTKYRDASAIGQHRLTRRARDRASYSARPSCGCGPRLCPALPRPPSDSLTLLLDMSSTTNIFVKSFTHLKDRPKADRALPLLQRIASLVKPIMRKHGWILPVLSEFFPESPNLVGMPNEALC